jgi:acetyl-CoA acetyltransferase/uncharacterized OB-fold protein
MGVKVSYTQVHPLPNLSPETEFFWKSGEDGKLRFQKDNACGALIHPPQPVCPYCRSSDLTIAEVSGSATLVAFTVNVQQWLPTMTPPYVVAVVTIDEDPRVRLTTNIVNCELQDVKIGQKVKVAFHHQDDVWLPLFEPSGAKELGAIPELDKSIYKARPMASAAKFEDKVVLSGIGQSEVGRRIMGNPLLLTVDACMKAIEDAGLKPEDIDGLATYPGGMMAGSGMSEGGITAVENVLRLRPTWHSGSSETPGQGGAIINAMLAVASGLCKHVLCFRTVWEARHAELMKQGYGRPSMGRVDGDMQWRIPFGASSASNWIAMAATQYMHKYGATRETLGWIALNARKNAMINPQAIYRDPLTMDDYLNARMITTPFGLYDCDVPCDGAVAVIVSAVDTVGDLKCKPIRVEAVGTQITEVVSWDQGVLDHEPMLAGPAAHLWTRTELKQKDIDVALLYDGFSFNCLSWLEALGFCGHGEAKDFLEGGHNIARDGLLPLNPHGGQISAGRTHGFGFVREAVIQLRGDGGERQIKDAKTAVISTGGGVPSSTMILRKD